MTRATHHAARSTKLRQTTWALLLVLALTAGLRWVGFRAFPPGLWYDEAYTLVEGQRLSQGGPFQIYYPEKHGEPAIVWLTALALRLGGNHLAPRWVSSVSSLIGVLLLFFAVRDIMRHETRQASWLALGSAAALGINYAFLFYSRMSWQGALATTTFIAAVWFFWRGMRDGRLWDFVLAGLMLGGSQYTSVAARLLPLTFLLVLAGWLGESRRWWCARWRGLLAAGVAASLTYGPLASAFLTHPEWFGRRLRTATSLSALLPNVGRTLAGWLWMGSAGLHSLPGRPIYDPAMGFLLLVGLGVAIWKIRRPAYSVWLAWFAAVLPGGFLSDPTPMFYRVVTAVPATATLCAVGGWHVWRFVTTRFPRMRHLAAVLLLSIFLASTWATCHDYFVRWANWPHLPAVMDVSKWRAAEAILDDSPADERRLVTIPDGLEPSISYALRARDSSSVRAFDGAHCLPVPIQTDTSTRYLVILGYEHRSLPRLQALFPSGTQTTGPIFDNGPPYFTNFFIPPGTEVPVPGKLPSPVTYQDIVLHGVHVSEPIIPTSQTFTVTLTWEILELTPKSYTVFTHLLDGNPEAAEDPLRAQHDGIPCDGTEPTWRWQPGEYILDEHVLTVPPDLPPGEYLLSVGLYDSDTLERLPPEGEDMQMRWGAALVSSVTVTSEQ